MLFKRSLILKHQCFNQKCCYLTNSIGRHFSSVPDKNQEPSCQQSSLKQTKISFQPYGPYTQIKVPQPLLDVNAQKLHKIDDMKTYESLIYNPNYFLIFFHSAKWSIASKVLYPEFKNVMESTHNLYVPCQSNPQTGKDIPKVFCSVDIDECPRAAYHSDVDDVPTITMMMGDDSLRIKIAPKDRCEYDAMISQLKDELLKFNRQPIHQLQKNLQSTSAWYDHNIRIDNLNIHRVNWPLR